MNQKSIRTLMWLSIILLIIGSALLAIAYLPAAKEHMDKYQNRPDKAARDRTGKGTGE